MAVPYWTSFSFPFSFSSESKGPVLVRCCVPRDLEFHRPSRPSCSELLLVPSEHWRKQARWRLQKATERGQAANPGFAVRPEINLFNPRTPISGLFFKRISKEMNLTLYFPRLLWPSITLTAELHLLKYVCTRARQSTLTDPGTARLSNPVKVSLLCGAHIPGTI